MRLQVVRVPTEYGAAIYRAGSNGWHTDFGEGNGCNAGLQTAPVAAEITVPPAATPTMNSRPASAPTGFGSSAAWRASAQFVYI